MAERVGFEPTALAGAAEKACSIQPLSHLSASDALNLSKNRRRLLFQLCVFRICVDQCSSFLQSSGFGVRAGRIELDRSTLHFALASFANAVLTPPHLAFQLRNQFDDPSFIGVVGHSPMCPVPPSLSVYGQNLSTQHKSATTPITKNILSNPRRGSELVDSAQLQCDRAKPCLMSAWDPFQAGGNKPKAQHSYRAVGLRDQ